MSFWQWVVLVVLVWFALAGLIVVVASAIGYLRNK